MTKHAKTAPRNVDLMLISPASNESVHTQPDVNGVATAARGAPDKAKETPQEKKTRNRSG